jgi:hypothetical protein
MNLAEKIEEAFDSRPKPVQVGLGDEVLQLDSDVEEAQWFAGRDWRSITWEDWEKHPVAIRFFSKEAFAYFLPSVLVLSLHDPKNALDAARSVIRDLDRSPDPNEWDPRFKDRYLDFNVEVYELLKEWLLQVCEYIPYKGWGISASGPGDRFGRAYDTVDLLQREIERSHRAGS